jgi:Helix-turn-helix domain
MCGVDSRNYVCILPISAAARSDTRHLLIAQSRQVCSQCGNIREWRWCRAIRQNDQEVSGKWRILSRRLAQPPYRLLPIIGKTVVAGQIVNTDDQLGFVKTLPGACQVKILTYRFHPFHPIQRLPQTSTPTCRSYFGFGFHEVIFNRRVERAKGLLRDPKLSVLDVSINVGFELQNNFARAFRRVIGVSPTQFRRDCL